jgi:hypothetical protein
MRTTREKIWYFLVDTKVNQYVAEHSVKYYQKWDLALNIFLAVTTSTSIAAWAIWQHYQLVWAVIIGISQFLTVAKPYFLFPKYIKAFNEKALYWQQLSFDLEILWDKINFSTVSEDKAKEAFFDYKKTSLTFDRMPDDIIFFHRDTTQRIAEEKCSLYLHKI